MDAQTIELYKKYLYGNIFSSEFLELKNKVNQLDDEALSKVLEEEWTDELILGKMNKEDKDIVKANLNFFIENQARKRRVLRRCCHVAAAIILLVLGGSVLFFTSSPPVSEFLVEVQAGNKVQTTLPDHSKVWMNSKSKLVVLNGLQKQRQVYLIGEAFFRVAKDKTKPFVVNVNHLQIEVLGTSFNVKARPESDFIETSLLEGYVRLSGGNLARSYELKPNEKAIYSK